MIIRENVNQKYSKGKLTLDLALTFWHTEVMPEPNKYELTDEEILALLNLLVDTIETDRYPLSPRIRLLREILVKSGEMGSVPAELAQKLRRYAPPPPARRPTPEEHDPSRALRQGR